MTEWARKIVKRFGVPATVFFAISIISVGSLVLPLWNYAKFYSALWGFDFSLLSVTIDASQIKVANRAQVNVTLLVTNPTDYSGLTVSSAKCVLKYYGDGHEVLEPIGGSPLVKPVWTNWWDLKTGIDSQRRSIGPNSNSTVLLEFSINPNSGSQGEQQDAWDFIEHLATNPGQITWSLGCSLTLSTFLGSFDRTNYFSYVTLV